LEGATRPVSAVREIAVESGRDAEHPDQITNHAWRQRRPTDFFIVAAFYEPIMLVVEREYAAGVSRPEFFTLPKKTSQRLNIDRLHCHNSVSNK